MTEPNQNPEPEANLNSIGPSTIRKRPSVKANPSDFPSFVQPPTANPLTYTNKLTGGGLALKRLGLKEEDVKGIPEITSRVREAAGSVKEAISLLRGDDSPDAITFIEKWDSMSLKDQKAAKLEWVVTAAQLSTRRFMELLAGAAFDHSATVSKIYVSRSKLKVMKATVKAATDSVPILDKDGEIVGHTNGDVKAQEMFHKITGALPTPKGSSFILNQQINTAKESDEPKTPLQAMDSFLMELDDVRKPKQLAAKTEPMIPVEMPDNAPEIEYLDLGEVV